MSQESIQTRFDIGRVGGNYYSRQGSIWRHRILVHIDIGYTRGSGSERVLSNRHANFMYFPDLPGELLEDLQRDFDVPLPGDVAGVRNSEPPYVLKPASEFLNPEDARVETPGGVPALPVGQRPKVEWVRNGTDGTTGRYRVKTGDSGTSTPDPRIPRPNRRDDHRRSDDSSSGSTSSGWNGSHLYDGSDRSSTWSPANGSPSAGAPPAGRGSGGKGGKEIFKPGSGGSKVKRIT